MIYDEKDNILPVAGQQAHQAHPAQPEEGRSEGVSNTPPRSQKEEGPKVRYNCSIDYLKVTFVGEFNPSRASYKEWDELLRAYHVDPKVFVERPGASGYQRGYMFNEEMCVFAGGAFTKSAGQDTFNIELKGKGCRQFEDDVKNDLPADADVDKAVHDAWRNLLATILRFNGKCTRIDLPTDDFDGTVPFAELKQRIKDHCFSSHLRSFNIDENPEDEDAGNYHVRESKNQGWTATLGSRSAAQLCIYNKMAERMSKGEDGFNCVQWIRYEVRFYHENAVTALAMLSLAYEDSNPTAVASFIVGCLAGLIDLKEKKTKRIRQAKTWEKWARFVDEVSALRVVSQSKVESTVDSNAAWLAEDASKAMARICYANPEWSIELYFALLKHAFGRIDGKDFFKINNWRKAHGMPAYKSMEEANAAVSEYIGKLPETSEEVEKLLFHDTMKLGSVKYTQLDGGNE